MHYGFKSPYRRFATSWWKDVFDIPRYLRACKWLWQRATRGWADCDVWSIDYYLNEVIPAMVRHLKETTMGRPCGISEKKWDEILEKIASGFEANDALFDYYPKDGAGYQDVLKKSKEGMKLFVKYYNNLWD